MSIRTPLAIAAAILIAACATPTSNYAPTVQAFSRPPLNTLSVAAVGDEMLSQGTLTEREGLELTAQAQISGYTLSPGFYPLTGRNDQGAYYSFFYQVPPQAGFGVISKNFIVDPPQALMTSSTDGQLCVVTVFNVRTCDQESFAMTRRTFEADSNFQQTLLYSGRVGDRVRVSYREFSGNMARPAFNNEVEYDLSVSNIIAYRGAQIRIVDANNTQITYEVLSNFNTPR